MHENKTIIIIGVLLILALIGLIIWRIIANHHGGTNSTSSHGCLQTADVTGCATMAVTGCDTGCNSGCDTGCGCPTQLEGCCDVECPGSFLNVQNISGPNTTYATKHAVGRDTMIVVDQTVTIPAATTTKLFMYTLQDGLWVQTFTTDVEGVSAKVQVDDVTGDLYCLTVAADMSNAGTLYTFAKTDTSYIESQQAQFGDLPRDFDVSGDYYIIMFPALASVFKNGVKFFDFTDIVPTDVAISCNGKRVVVASTGSVYVFRRSSCGNYKFQWSILDDEASFGKEVDINTNSLAILSDSAFYLYDLCDLKCPKAKVQLDPLIPYHIELASGSFVLWSNVVTNVYVRKTDCTWCLSKVISTAGSVLSWTSHSCLWTMNSKNIGVDANVGLSIWKRTS